MQDQEIVIQAAQKLYDRKAGEIVALKTGHLNFPLAFSGWVWYDFRCFARQRVKRQITRVVRW